MGKTKTKTKFKFSSSKKATRRREPKRLKTDTTPDEVVVEAVSCPWCCAAKGEGCHRYAPHIDVENGGPVRPHPDRRTRYRRWLRARRMTTRIDDLTAEDRRRLGLDRVAA